MAALVIGSEVDPVVVAWAHHQTTRHGGWVCNSDYTCHECLLTIADGIVVRGERGVR